MYTYAYKHINMYTYINIYVHIYAYIMHLYYSSFWHTDYSHFSLALNTSACFL